MGLLGDWGDQERGTEMNWFHSRVGSLRGMVSVTTQRGHHDLHSDSVADQDLLLFPYTHSTHSFGQPLSHPFLSIIMLSALFYF